MWDDDDLQEQSTLRESNRVVAVLKLWIVLQLVAHDVYLAAI